MLLNRILDFLLVFFVIACTPKKDIPIQTSSIPSYFPPIVTPKRNPTSIAGVELGRKLFYDPILSKNNTISCATCHIQSKAFTDGLVVTNKGTSGKFLARNTPSLFNLTWGTSFLWDGGANDLESQAFMPIMHTDEMAMDLVELTKLLNNHPNYSYFFKDAFNVDSITSAHIARALAQFQRSIVSSNSKYDLLMMGKSEFTEIEAMGYELFQEKGCIKCHTPPLFSDNLFHNNGLDSIFSKENEGVFLGRSRITQNKKDIGKFKTPSLRNIELTAPYMHNGSLSSLEEVLDHYQNNVKFSETLDSIFIKGDMKLGVTLTELDKKALITFLKTLTDDMLTSNPNYTNPFQ